MVPCLAGLLETRYFPVAHFISGENMAKAYFCVLLKDTVNNAVIDLDNLPAGTSSDEVEHFAPQGVDIGLWLKSDLNRAVRVADNIRNGMFDAESCYLISKLASLYENMPPASEQKDLFIAVRSEQTDIVRTSPEVAEETWRKVSNIGRTPA